MTDSSKLLKHRDYRWDGIEQRSYKRDSSDYRDVTRQTLLGDGVDEGSLNLVARYFEVQPGGYSTLERHEHSHMVFVVRGSGKVVLGARVFDIDHLDCVYVGPNSFHQFYATGDEPLGFLCVVDRARDRPVLPSADELRELASNPQIAELFASQKR